jgi:hypothetical protein
MICNNCKRLIVKPVEHEYCVYRMERGVYNLIGKVNLDKITQNTPLPEVEEYVPPLKQPEIKHQLADKGARPAIKHREFGEEQNDNPSLGLATRRFEE